jgi:outer membrane protein assembly factor BamB
MIVVDRYLVTQEQRGDLEAVVCYEAATGSELWIHTDQERFEEALSGTGPRGTPTFANGRVYALGANGRLTCLSPRDGTVIWAKQPVKDAGGAVPQWGYSVSPLVVDGKVIVFAGGEGEQGLIAFDAETGKPVWSQVAGTMSYSSPQLLTLHDQPQIVMHDNHGVRALSVDDGSVLWQHGTKSEVAMPMLQPQRVSGNRVLLATDPGIGLLDVQRDGESWTVQEVWSTSRLKPAFNDFVVYEKHIYGLDDGILCCIDLASGQRVWKRGRYGHGQLLLLAEQGALLVLSETGEVVLVEAKPDQHQELGRFQAIEGKTWNHPVLAHGRLYVRNAEEMAAYDLP